MSIKTILVVALCTLILRAQAEDEPNVVNVDLGSDGQQFGQQQFGQQQMSIEDQQRYYGMRRTACLVLSRHHSNGNKEQIEPILSQLPAEQQQKFINKMYALAVEKCEETIVPDEVQQLYIENNNFDPSSLFHVFSGFDYSSIGTKDFKLSKNQENIVEYIKNFDQEMEMKREEQEAAKEEQGEDDRFGIKIFGIDASNISTSAKLLYVLVFGAIVGGLLYYGIRELNKSDQTTKRKESSKRKAAAAAAAGSSSPRSASPTSPNKKKD